MAQALLKKANALYDEKKYDDAVGDYVELLASPPLGITLICLF